MLAGLELVVAGLSVASPVMAGFVLVLPGPPTGPLPDPVCPACVGLGCGDWLADSCSPVLMNSLSFPLKFVVRFLRQSN